MVDTSNDAANRGWAAWQRRLIEGMVALLAFAVWGMLAYQGGFRIIARIEGLTVGGHWIWDAACLMVGVAGSIAGVTALWALLMRIFGRTPTSIVGAPDDAPEDLPAYVRLDTSEAQTTNG